MHVAAKEKNKFVDFPYNNGRKTAKEGRAGCFKFSSSTRKERAKKSSRAESGGRLLIGLTHDETREEIEGFSLDGVHQEII